MGIEKRLIEDANLTRGMQLATPERITKVIRDVLKGEAGARVKVYEQTCMRCGACAKACHFSLSHPDDASYTPVADKTSSRWSARAEAQRRTDAGHRADHRAHRMQMCRRCIHYCPAGVDIAYLMSPVRRICNKLGITPDPSFRTPPTAIPPRSTRCGCAKTNGSTASSGKEEAREEFPRHPHPA